MERRMRSGEEEGGEEEEEADAAAGRRREEARGRRWPAAAEAAANGGALAAGARGAGWVPAAPEDRLPAARGRTALFRVRLCMGVVRGAREAHRHAVATDD